MSVQCHVDIVQYEAEILLPEDFYEDRKKRQSQESIEQQKIDELVLAVCQDNVYITLTKSINLHLKLINHLMSCSDQSAFEWQSNFK